MSALGRAPAQLLRTSVRPSTLSRRHHQLPRDISALAILIPHRAISTEQHTSHASHGPPPGFNPNEAKKPLPKETSGPKDSVVNKTQSASADTAAKGKESQNAKATDTDKSTQKEEKKSLSELAAEKAKEQGDAEKVVARREDKKLTTWQKVKKEAQHYWDGTKLLATEIRISTRLALKMASGYELTRREHRQLQRTVQDLARLVPFSAFIIVPFGEIFLPFALKVFPNLLPSTYESSKQKDNKASVLRTSRKEVSDFLRGTLKETGLPITPATTQKEEFTNFFRKVRTTGEQPTEEDVINICKIFRDDLTLDNLSRPQLVSMCKYMNLSTFGTDTMLRYQVRHRMRQIKRDDKTISYEGVESLTVGEVQTACASRGIKTHGMSPARLREDLQAWLDLRLTHGVPSTLLVLSNAYMYAESPDKAGSQIDALLGALSSIPEELFHEIQLEVSHSEGSATNKQRLEVLKEQQELIEEENEQNQENQNTGFATPRDVDNIDEKEEQQPTQADAKAAEKAAGRGLAAQQLREAVEAEETNDSVPASGAALKQAEAEKRESAK